jgi:hypothetical protein
MANYLAIATVTEALRQRIEQAVRPIFPGAQIHAKRPEAGDGQAQAVVSLFLYRVSPNTALRNADLPTRSSDGRDLRQRPRAALDLHYLISFAGQDEQLEAQRMLGLTIAALYSEPTLMRSAIRDLVQSGEIWITDSDLAEDQELVRFSMASLNIDELSKLWTTFGQVPYQLSLAYDASVVLVEPDLVATQALPVQRGSVDALPLRQPLIERVQALGRSDNVVLGDSALQIEILGQRLRGQHTFVSFDNGEPQAVVADRDTRIVVPNPVSATLSAGIHGVQILHQLALGDPPTLHYGVESNTFAFIVRPQISVELQGDELVLEFNPSIQPDQRIRLLLNELNPNPPSDRTLYFYNLDPLDEPNPGPWQSRRFALTNVEAGKYLVRAQVNGAESLIVFVPDPTTPGQQIPMPQVEIL